MESGLTKSLLLSGGHNFEVRVLTAQIQATDYIMHILESLKNSEPNDQRKTRLNTAQKNYEKLNSEAYLLLGAKK
jgi:hypothetical protein